MSTRAVYTIKDNDDTFHIYIHCDGYPQGSANYFNNLINFYGCDLKHFEAMEVSASFVACNKKRTGNVYLTQSWENHGDLEYRYELISGQNNATIRAYTMPNNKLFYDGSLIGFIEAYPEMIQQVKG